MRKAGRYFVMMIIILLLIIELRSVVQLLVTGLMLVLGGRLSVVLVLLWTVLVLFDVLAVNLLLCRCYSLISHHETVELNCMISRCGRKDNKAMSLAAAIIHLGMNILSLIMVVLGGRSGLFFDTLDVVNTRINGFIIFLVCVWAMNIVVIIIFQVVYIWKCIQSKA